MISDQDVWLVWSSAFLVPWLGVFVAFPHYRQPMVWASLCTAPLGLTEPLFVPAYWSPPSLLNLARTTGFDIESLIFSFAIGGIGAVLYDIIAGRVLITVPPAQRHTPRHKLHYLAIAVPFFSFPLLYLFDWNPIYRATIAMALGAVATMLCRPDLARKTWVGALLFVAFYSVVSARSRTHCTRLRRAGLELGRSFGRADCRHAPGGVSFRRHLWRVLVRCLRTLHLEKLVDDEMVIVQCERSACQGRISV